MSGLSFLKNVTLAANSAVNPKARTASAAAKNPENADIRIYKNGAVYPSQKLVDKCALQYLPKDSATVGNGFDVFSSGDFLNTKHLADKFLFIALVPKNKPKVDLFGSTVYETDGSPKSDVLTQGANTKGKEILALIETVYGISIPETGSYLDLKIVKDQPFKTDDNIYYIPKTVSRGNTKGESEVIRRENLTLYALVPAELLEEQVPDEGQDVKPAPVVDKAQDIPVADPTVQKAAVVEEAPEPEVESPQAAVEDEPLPPTLDEIDAETDEKPAPAAKLPADVLDETAAPEVDDDIDPAFSVDEDDDTLTV